MDFSLCRLTANILTKVNFAKAQEWRMLKSTSFQGLCLAFWRQSSRLPVSTRQTSHKSVTVSMSLRHNCFCWLFIAVFSLQRQFNYSALASPHLFHITCSTFVWVFFFVDEFKIPAQRRFIKLFAQQWQMENVANQWRHWFLSLPGARI